MPLASRVRLATGLGSHLWAAQPGWRSAELSGLLVRRPDCHSTHCHSALDRAAFSAVRPEPPTGRPPAVAHFPQSSSTFQSSGTIRTVLGIITPWVLVAFVSRAVPESPVVTAAVCHPLGFTLQR